MIYWLPLVYSFHTSDEIVRVVLPVKWKGIGKYVFSTLKPKIKLKKNQIVVASYLFNWYSYTGKTESVNETGPWQIFPAIAPEHLSYKFVETLFIWEASTINSQSETSVAPLLTWFNFNPDMDK